MLTNDGRIGCSFQGSPNQHDHWSTIAMSFLYDDTYTDTQHYRNKLQSLHSTYKKVLENNIQSLNTEKVESYCAINQELCNIQAFGEKEKSEKRRLLLIERDFLVKEKTAVCKALNSLNKIRIDIKDCTFQPLETQEFKQLQDTHRALYHNACSQYKLLKTYLNDIDTCLNAMQFHSEEYKKEAQQYKNEVQQLFANFRALQSRFQKHLDTSSLNFFMQRERMISDYKNLDPTQQETVLNTLSTLIPEYPIAKKIAKDIDNLSIRARKLESPPILENLIEQYPLEQFILRHQTLVERIIAQYNIAKEYADDLEDYIINIKYKLKENYHPEDPFLKHCMETSETATLTHQLTTITPRM